MSALHYDRYRISIYNRDLCLYLDGGRRCGRDGIHGRMDVRGRREGQAFEEMFVWQE